jgi:cell volume regulation protein A
VFWIDTLLLIAGILILLGIASSKFSARFGVPVLVLFLVLGMLAGSEGLGGIDFEDYPLAHAIGTVALAVILFDGGLNTPMASIRLAWRPALILATAGVLITAVVTGVAAARILNISLLEGLLLGSIVGSTDAAAVFAILRAGGVRLPTRLAATLEMESGSNDPMAIFLTVGLLQVLSGRLPLGPGLLGLFVTQMAVGTLVGLAIGYASVWLVNRIHLDAAGLYPILVGTCGLLAYGLAASLDGSGFLAAYLAGIVIGNRRLVFRRGVFLFHDAAAWLAQIVMFVVLGLLSFPSRLWEVAGRGLLIAVILTLVARPLAVLLLLLPLRFNRRELLFLSWVGLKGAVPNARLLFNVVFFVVLVSALIQGWSIPWVARQLGVQRPAEPVPPITLEISSLRHVEGDIVDYSVDEHSRAAGRLVRELALPDGAVIAVLARQQKLIPPQGDTRILAGDHAILVLSPLTKPLVDKVFGREEVRDEELPPLLEFPLRGSTKVADLEACYGISMNAPPESTLDQAIRARLGGARAEPGSHVRFGPIALYVRKVNDRGTIDRVGMVVLVSEETAGPSPTAE